MSLELNAELFGLQIMVLVVLIIFAGITKLFNEDWAKPIFVSSGVIFLLFCIVDIVLAVNKNSL